MADDTFPVISSTLPDGTTGLPYFGTLSATGGSTPYSWSSSPDDIGHRKLPNSDPNKSLPLGLFLDTNTGIIQGIPLLQGGFSFPIYVADSFGHIRSSDVVINLSGDTDTPYKKLVLLTPNAKYYWQLNEAAGTTFTDLIQGIVLSSETPIVAATDPKSGYANYTYGYEPFQGQVNYSGVLPEIHNNLYNYTIEFWTNIFSDTGNPEKYSIFYYGGNGSGVNDDNYVINIWRNAITGKISLDWQYGNGNVESNTFDIVVTNKSHIVIQKSSIDLSLILTAFFLDENNNVTSLSSTINYIHEPSGGTRNTNLYLCGIKSNHISKLAKGLDQIPETEAMSFSDLAFYVGSMNPLFLESHFVIGTGTSIISNTPIDPTLFPIFNQNPNPIILLQGDPLDLTFTIINGSPPYTVKSFKLQDNNIAVQFDGDVTITVTGNLPNLGTFIVGIMVEDSNQYQTQSPLNIIVSKPEIRIYRSNHTASLLKDNTVLIAGGIDDQGDQYGPYVKKAQIYDNNSRLFLPIADMNLGRYQHTSTTLQTGEVLITGGTTQAGITNNTELYNVGSFVTSFPMNVSRHQHTATLLLSGHVLITGGSTSSIHPKSELFIKSIGFSFSGELSVNRLGHTATLLIGGKVLIVGGYDGGSSVYNSAEIYDPVTGLFTPTGSLNTERFNHTATLLNGGNVLITGGKTSSGITFTAEIFDPNTGLFTYVGNLNLSRYNHTATAYFSGNRVMITGGQYSPFASDATEAAEIYDIVSQTFTFTSPLNANREFHTATLVSNNEILIACGNLNVDSDTTGLYTLSALDLYDPNRATFQPISCTYDPTFLAAQMHLVNDTFSVIGLKAGNTDDGYYKIVIPFSFKVFGVDYGNDQNGGIYVGTNGYITFGYHSLSHAPSPSMGKAFMLCGGDRSSGKLKMFYDGNTIRFRQEGGIFPTDPDSNTLLYEVTFFKDQKMNLVWGFCPEDGVMGISDGVSLVPSVTFASNTSYAFESDTHGNTWSITSGEVSF